jgi:flagellar basal body-associated protein FliL
MGFLANMILILIIALVLFGVTLPVWYVLWLAKKTRDWNKKATPEERRKMKKAVQISASMK